MNSDSRKVVIFCSASAKIDPKYNEAAAALTRGLCAAGYEIVSGGTVKGTMGVVSETVRACGGTHTGILPLFMKQFEYPGLSNIVYTETMSQRKDLMREDTCACIALPGGIGTLDELVETLTLRKLNRYGGQVMALDLDGFYAPLRALLDHYVLTGMLEPADRDLIRFPASVREVLDLLGEQER